MNVFTSYEDVPMGAHIVRKTGERKGWCLERVVPISPFYHGPHFHSEELDCTFQDWDLPDDKEWELMI